MVVDLCLCKMIYVIPFENQIVKKPFSAYRNKNRKYCSHMMQFMYLWLPLILDVLSMMKH